MVFESLVVDLINRFLGDVIENLDKSQLSIGIWGGDVVLNNLFIKENLFNDLDLPLKVIYGNIGQLKLRIPWKNLYSDSTVAMLDGLYIIVVPNTNIEYDAKKEEKSAWESKMKILNKIEDAKKNETADPDSKKADDSFAEKLITNIIKNLEVKITNIHVRYEDNVTDPNKSFVFGVILAELSCQTTDENWKAVIVKETTNIIYKLLKMENFSLYCNIGQPIYQKNDRNAILQNLKSNIVNSPDKNKYQYVIEPMSLAGTLRLNLKPESDDFKTAKIFLNFLLENIGIGLSKSQYQSLICFLDSYGQMQLASKFRKYRPRLEDKRNYKKWWKFAIDCILYETVKRHREMWQWNNIKLHKDICKKYKSLYKMKITNQKLTQDMIVELDTCERKLDILNITIARKQADIEAKKEGLMKPPASGGWFSGWFGKGSSKSNEEKPTIQKMEELLTPEEKLKLYSAIGYQENSNAILPKEYVATKINFKLDKIGLKFKDDFNKYSEVFNLLLHYLECDINQRPGADAIMVNGSLKSLILSGQTSALNLNIGPMLISSEEEVSPDCQLLGFKFETNPVDGSCDQNIQLMAQSLRIIYDAQTIISLVSFLKPPDSLYLEKLQNNAMTRMSKVSQNTVSGFQHALSKRKILKVNVNIKPTYLIIPQTGYYTFNCRMLVLDLGILSVSTEERKTEATQKLSLEELKHQAYDTFKVKVERIQILLVNPDKDWVNWEENRTLGESNIHILKPMNIDVTIKKCSIDDAELPELRVLGVLPDISLQLSDIRLVEILSLLESIPLPPSSSAQDFDDIDNMAVAVDLSNLTIEEEPENIIITDQSVDNKAVNMEINSYEKSNIEMTFEIKEVCVILSRFETGVNIPVLKFLAGSIGCTLDLKLFNKYIHFYIGGIYLQHLSFKASKDLNFWYRSRLAISNGPLVNLVNTLTVDDQDNKLLDVMITMADRKHPDLITRFNNCLQKLNIVFSEIEIILHQEALLDIMLYFNNIEKLKSQSVTGKLVRQISRTSLHTLTSSIKMLENKKAKSKHSSKKQELIDLMILLRLEKLAIGICTQHRLIVDIRIEEMSAGVTMQISLTSIEINLKELNIFDRHHDAIYSQILSFTGSNVFNVIIKMYNKMTEEELNINASQHHLSVKFVTGQMKFVFLNLFVQQLLSFLNNFDAAKKSIQETQLAASKKAAAIAENVQANTTRLKLDIKIKAPLILVPEHSKSNVVISFDLGEIVISNIFKISQFNKQPLVLDMIYLQLEQLKISRMIIMDNVIRAECLMLNPISLTITIIRNLSIKSCPQQPDLDITANMNDISMAISKSELATLFNVLNKNLNEKDLKLPIQESHIVPIEHSLDKPLYAIPEGSEVDIEEARCTLKLNFKLSNICLHLFESDKMIVIGDANCHEQETSFSNVELRNIIVSVIMRSDKSMNSDFILRSIRLRDLRPNREECITELITQIGSNLENNELITLNFIQDMKLNKEVKLCIDELRIILFMEFLLKLSQFIPNKDDNNDSSKIQPKDPKKKKVPTATLR